MKTLVLCVDRDDDLGMKAGISGPVIGREENLKAHIALGLADPEDVDANTILAGLQLYDDLVKRGMDAEIATISGDSHLGIRADHILKNQLENVLEIVKPDGAVLVSDGAEDEQIYPVISSRVKIDSVKRVYVKQSKSVEGTYYMVMKTLQDEKMRRRWIMPISITLIVAGLFFLTIRIIEFRNSDYDDLGLVSGMAWGVIGIILGFYLISWAYHWADLLQMRINRTRRAMRQGSPVLVASIVAFLFVLSGVFVGFDLAMVYREGLLPDDRSIAISILLFISGALWFSVFAVFTYETGKAFNAILTGKVKWSYIVMMISVLAIGFIMQGAIDAMFFFVSYGDPDPLMIFAEIITGILIAMFSSVLNASLRSEAKEASPGA